jgi:TRAP-type C4-dicarboxylate transport system substrate-binding protein
MQNPAANIASKFYCSGQLGTERECIELLQIGSLSMTKVSSSVLESFVHSFSVYNLPYLFRDDEHRAHVLEGEVGRQLLLDCQKYWVRGLCYFDAGSRSFYSKAKPINSPDDLQGLKIRTQEESDFPYAWCRLWAARPLRLPGANSIRRCNRVLLTVRKISAFILPVASL